MEYYLSAERLKELKDELDNLKTVRRLGVSERLKRAKELGDLSENSEYQEARNEQEEVEMRISELEQIVKNAKELPKTASKDHVEIGSTVEVAKQGGETRKFTIVGSKEVRPEAGLISNESPLGKALMGAKRGESVKVKTPAGEAKYTVVAIE